MTLKQVPPAVAGSNWSLLNSGGTSLTAAQTVTISGISGKDKIMVIVEAASSVNSNSHIGVRLNGDTTSKYYSYGNLVAPSNSGVAPTQWSYYGGASTYVPICQITDASYGEGANGYALFTGCNSDGVKEYTASGGTYGGSSGPSNVMVNVGGYYNSSSTITSVSIYSSTGNLDAGKVYVYASA